MLDADQPDTNATAPSGGVPEGVGTADTPPVVTRTTRKAPARRAAAKSAAPATEPTPTAGPADASAASQVAGTESTEEPKTPAKKTAAKRTAAKKAPAKKAAATRAKKAPAESAPVVPAETPAEPSAEVTAADAGPVVRKTATRKTAARKTAAKKAADAAATTESSTPAPAPDAPAAQADAGAPAVLFQAPVATSAVTTTTRRTRKKAVASPVVEETDAADSAAPEDEATQVQSEEAATEAPSGARRSGARRGAAKKAAAAPADAPSGTETSDTQTSDTETSDEDEDDQNESTEPQDDTDDEGGATRRRRRRGGRRRRKSGDSAGGDDEGEASDATEESDDSEADSEEQGADSLGDGTSRRRRRRRRTGEEGSPGSDDEPNTVTRVRRTRSAEDQITAVAGSTRLEAKKQRRREGREAGRRRAPIVSEAEFLARRESVERVMVIRQRKDLTQIAVLEDKVLVEHYVARESQTSLIGNVYLGRVQNVLPSMEAAFIDIGKGRNAVLYAGEVNWSALGHKDGQARKIESVLSSGQMILVQVTKDPIGHKGARLTSQVSLAGRFLVYVPDGTTSGISRKLPDTERNRLKTLLKEIVPDSAGVIVRTAAEGASEEELTHDVERLKSRWEEIEKKSTNRGSGPQLLYGEPDLTLKVVRDLFTEDFVRLVIEGDDAWQTVHGYVEQVAPDLAARVEKFERADNGRDSFATYRIDEQIQKGLDRKVWLPSGGSLVIDRTEAMTVVDVNTGKFTGSGGNLEETVTKNNLEAAEEMVRQLRLRDIGGIIVVDFIDMVLESNRDLVVRRLVECLGRDRTRHQVAEVTSLGLVQMTRKRIGTGLLEAFSENCEHCQGRGVVIKDQPVDSGGSGGSDDGDARRSSSGGGSSSGNSRRRGRRGANGEDAGDVTDQSAPTPSPKDVAAMARNDKAVDEPAAQSADKPLDQPTGEVIEEPANVPTDESTDDVPAKRPGRRTRGRSSDRSGPTSVEPAAAMADEADSVVVEAVAKGADVVATQPALAESEAAPSAEDVAQDEEKTPESSPPQVVTRTRRRAASRPAGPPPASEAQEVPAVQTFVPDSGTQSGSEPAAPVVTHVPIKKRGTRKR